VVSRLRDKERNLHLKFKILRVGDWFINAV
jgi:hypothetical protein